ncbi:flavin reductase family protein [Eggerthellaceae bacterium zg-997]|nr:flavin reductase family protein [Eggerthellaceae bacterium zg-997]
MNKRPIEPFEHASQIAQAVPHGVLLTSKAGDEVNSMVIGWGHLGTIWGRTVFVAYVRASRHTHSLLERNPQFTINVPTGRMRGDIMKVAGTQTGRAVNKIERLGLTLIDGEVVSVPAVAECPLTLECQVMYRQTLEVEGMPAPVRERFYPVGVADPDVTGANRYTHVAYYGGVVASYLLED